MIAPSSSTYNSNDMVHNHYLEEAKKKTYEIGGFLLEIYSPIAQPRLTGEPINGSNDDITNQYECEQTLDVSAGNLNLSAAMTSDHNSSELRIHNHGNKPSSSKLVPKVVPPTDKTATSQQVLELLFSRMYEEYFNAGNRRSGYHQKDKTAAKYETEHGMEKTVQNQGQSPKMPKSESICEESAVKRSRN
ncbi:hypothetical protein Tco_0262125 [Tanacetum coccineum]